MHVFKRGITSYVFALLLLLNFSSSKAQVWMDNGLDSDGQLNFFKVQQNFEEYWKGKTPEKGQGYKTFRRWEDYWSSRVDENGHFPPAGIKQLEWERYVERQSGGNRVAGAWTNLGPTTSVGGYAGIGRINSMAFHPTDVNTIFACSAGGGLWKSTNGGTNWTTSTDALAHLGTSGLAINPTNPSIMYLATGDGDANDTYSIGVLKSTNGGDTWSTTGLNWAVTNSRSIREILLHPENPDIVLVATSNGVYRSINAGVSWTQEQTGNFRDIEASKAFGSNTFFASTSTEVFKSTNSGDTFTSVYTVTGSNRIELAVTNANTDYIYALASLSTDSGFKGLYRSTDGGTSWSTMSTTPNILGYSENGSGAGGQGWYDLCIAADPLVANTIYIGGVNTWKSLDGGVTWTLNNFWYSLNNGIPAVHADKHSLDFQNNTTLWIGCDGGAYVSTNGGTSWTDKSNTLVISQMYRLAVSQTDTKVITGLQDNGTKLRSTAGVWSDVIGGDGMECQINRTNSNIMYGAIQNGELRRSTNGGSSWTDIQNTIPGAPGGSWITPYELDPTTPSTIYAGYAQLYKSTNQGTNWTSIGNTTQLGTSNKTILRVAPSNSNFIYTGTSSAIYKTADGGISWNKISLPGTDISMLEIHPTKPNTIWVVRRNYTAGAKVYRSIDGGVSWNNISGTLPNLPVNCIVHNNDLAESLYIGMDVGIFYINYDLPDWIPFSDGMPNVEIFDLDINYLEDKIYAATYGRGLWKSDLFVPAIPACYAAIDVSASPNAVSMTISWEAPTSMPALGYEYAVTTNASPPASGTLTISTLQNISGLTANTTYYVHVRSKCGSSSFSLWKTAQAKTSLTCGSIFYDSGGVSGQYGNNQDITTVICPDVLSGKTATMTFTAFSTEANYDALYIYNGNSILSPLMASANPVTTSGFPAGGYHGTTLPGTFVSTHPSGCLTAKFLSDGSTTSSGWAGNITCSDVCTNVVSSTGDTGPGTLRYAFDCLTSGFSVINMNPFINNQTITLTSGTINLSKALTIAPLVSQGIKIQGANNGPIFTVSDAGVLNLENMELRSGSNPANRVILNNGTTTLKNMVIKDPNVMLGTGNTIENNGMLDIIGSVQIKQN